MKRSLVMKKLAMIAILLVATTATAAEQAKPAATPAATPPVADRADAVKPLAANDPKEDAKDAEATQASLLLKAPLFSPRFEQFPVALVNDEPIFISELTEALGAIHRRPGEGKAGKKDYLAILDRLINVSLIKQEAANMGLDELPEIKKEEADYSRTTLVELLKELQLRDVKPDPAMVEKIYQQAAQEWKIKSVRFDKEEDAKELSSQILAGGSFDDLVNKLIDEKKAEGSKEGGYVPPNKLLPQIASVVASMQVGTVSQVMPIGPAFTILKLEAIRIPEDNAEARAEAYQQALSAKKTEVLGKFWETLKKKYVTIDEKLLKKLDFDAPKPGFAKLAKDKRVIARVKGEKAITIAELAEAMKKKFFHGIEEQLKMKKVDEKKYPVLEDLLYKRIYEREALARKIDASPEYKNAVKKFHTSLIFGKFIEKVVVPDVKVKNEEVKAYYDEHIAEYTDPEMIRIKGLAFNKKAFAESALDALRKSTDFQWLKVNAEGQADPKSPGLLEFEDKPVMTKNLPSLLHNALTGAKTGDARLLESPEGYFYLVSIVEVIPAKPSPVAAVREEIGKKVYNTKLGKAVEEWAAKLRKAYTVKVYLSDSGK